MTKVFIGGSRRITRLSADVRRKIDRIIDHRSPILIGDASGVDAAVQRYLQSKHYEQVEVFCMGNHCRNNVGNWPTKMVPVDGKKKGFEFYATKDREMTNKATVGFMIWDGESGGTLLNILRLLRQHKRVIVYNNPAREFSDLEREADWQVFTAHCPPVVVEKALLRAKSEEKVRVRIRQASLF